jgi:recombination protein RecA
VVPVEEVKAKKPTAAAKKPVAVSNVAALCRGLIFKHTEKKPVEPFFSTMAHVSSGSTIINNLIGGSMARDGKGPICPGFPRRRITELYGAESSGKTSVALAAIVECQKNGGVAAFLDFEHALHHGYARTIGVDFSPDKLLFYQPDTLEEGMKMMYLCIRAGVDLVVVDSVASMITKDELEKGVDDAEKIGSLAAPLTRNLKKLVIWLSKYPDPKEQPGLPGCSIIFINQTRAKIGGSGYGDQEDHTPGGKALKFFSTVRLKLTRIKSEILKKKDPVSGKEKSFPYGNVTIAKMVKNKLDSKNGQDGWIFIRFGYGVDDFYSLIESALANKILKKDGNTLSFGGLSAVGRDKFRQVLLSNTQVAEEFKKKVTASIVASGVVTTPDEDEEALLEAQIREDLGDEETFEKETAAEETIEVDEEV